MNSQIRTPLQPLSDVTQVSVRAGASTAGSLLLGLPATMHLLAILITIDIATGLLVGFAQRRLSSAISRRGIARKAQIILAVAGAEAASRLLGIEVTMPWGAVWSLGAVLAAWFSIHEALSIVENLAILEVPLPRRLLEALHRLGEIDPDKQEARHATEEP